MIQLYRSFLGTEKIQELDSNCWVHCVQPDSEEVNILQEEYHVSQEIIQDILDNDERPRYETDDDYNMVILRIPVEEQVPGNNGNTYTTYPLGVIMFDDYTVTICNVPNNVLPVAQPSVYRNSSQPVYDVVNFTLNLFIRSANSFMYYLRQIYKHTSLIEAEIEHAISNKVLSRLLMLQKCLVFFQTSLKSNEAVLAKFKNSRRSSISEMNEDLFEDALIETKQAVEMSNIYYNIQTSLKDTFDSVISNNLNQVMKKMTSVSIILMIPTLVASFYGMNVRNGWEEEWWAMPVVVLFSILASGAGILISKKKDWF
ncbi:MAG: magnesium transporter CorA family protein [Bacteroidales bacterium]|nr:magnesium transporter CorA family protein [Bacteroidales bacterium]